MPRDARIELAGGIHHVTARSPSRRLLFRDDRDRLRYLDLMAATVAHQRWQVFSYCLMTNHVHFLIRTPEANLGEGIKHVHETFATETNRRYDEHGHVFGERFYNGLVERDAHLFGCFRYIARNPVVAGVCRDPAAWEWSSHRALAGHQAPPDFLATDAALGFFADDIEKARTAYARMTCAPDEALLSSLRVRDPARWLLTAVEAFRVPLASIAEYLSVSERTVYRRLEALRLQDCGGVSHQCQRCHWGDCPLSDT